jgi:hypothetical protein
MKFFTTVSIATALTGSAIAIPGDNTNSNNSRSGGRSDRPKVARAYLFSGTDYGFWNKTVPLDYTQVNTTEMSTPISQVVFDLHESVGSKVKCGLVHPSASEGYTLTWTAHISEHLIMYAIIPRPAFVAGVQCQHDKN